MRPAHSTRFLPPLIALVVLGLAPLAPAAAGFLAVDDVHPVTVADEALCAIRERWVEDLLVAHPEGAWAPMRVDLTDAELAHLGLPPARVLRDADLATPTMVSTEGVVGTVDLGADAPAVAAFAGAGCLGIRPGAWLLLIDEEGIGWCSLAHVYADKTAVATAGHCGKTGTTATVIAAYGNRGGTLDPILLDFGTFTKSSDGGPGNDWALIGVDAQWQHLVSPTMCFWGGPLGTYTAQGAVVETTVPKNPNRLPVPDVTLNPDPTLAQAVVHYGHGTGVGTAGTPRVAAAEHWTASSFTFFGAITPGDSGAGANALAGDAEVTEANEAAGIMTHLWVDPFLRQGLGVMLGTRSTQVQATLTPGQVAPYPAPADGLP